MICKLSNKYILEGIRATDLNTIEREVNRAIDEGFAISIQYKQQSPLRGGQNRKGTSVRYLEPWGIGLDRRTGRKNIRVFQVNGDSTSGKKSGFWKTISLDSIINLIVLDGEDGTGAMPINTSFTNRPRFEKNDAHIKFYNYIGKNQRRLDFPPDDEDISIQTTSQTNNTGQTQPTYDNETLAEAINKILKIMTYDV